MIASTIIALLAMQASIPQDMEPMGRRMGMDMPQQLQAQGTPVTVINDGPDDVVIQVDGVNQASVTIEAGRRGGLMVSNGLAILHVRHVGGETRDATRMMTGSGALLVLGADGSAEWVSSDG